MCYYYDLNFPSLIAFLRLSSVQKVALREHVVRQINSGVSVHSISATLPFSTRTIYRWLCRYALGGFAGLRDRKRTGLPRKWTAEHADWLYATVVNKTPEQYQFEFALWTVGRLRIALHQHCGVSLSQTTVRRILRSMGLSPQRPKRRALKFSPHAVTFWKSQSFPRIVRHARETGATIVFADEAGLDSRCVYGRTWGEAGRDAHRPRGELEVPGEHAGSDESGRAAVFDAA